LHLAPKPDRLSLGDAANQIVEEIELGFQRRKSVLTFDNEDCPQFWPNSGARAILDMQITRNQ